MTKIYDDCKVCDFFTCFVTAFMDDLTNFLCTRFSKSVYGNLPKIS